MPKSRVESFSGCVIAFAITLLILDIHLEGAGANIDNGRDDSGAVGSGASFLDICH